MISAFANYYKYSHSGMKIQIPCFRQHECDKTGSGESLCVSQVMENIRDSFARKKDSQDSSKKCGKNIYHPLGLHMKKETRKRFSVYLQPRNAEK